ncbi:Pc13g00620 [Penicillium rubens Wisconsin 54-1255]|uniref:Pc13g00620 protein n=1 Tax=Penicillium rubens (strain ATCC 28089 / DSM 1075 / NRRL 1951 / Wisconsin 54-1255) TaxID=500485 RepID=B6H150_PENRW|nr:Pc13g00620 [Penicillium rubens Wisconsin 54-1255]
MANQRKSHVFRVTGLSIKLPDGDLKTDEDFRTALYGTLNDNFIDDENSQIKSDITIVPSCYESDTQRVALVQFRGGMPQFLRDHDPLGDWQVEIGDDDISFDCHFFGFTQLYTLDENKPVDADIIAIAGLDGHAYGSWQGRGNLGRMWLRDFLSKDLPQCRTMIYGYNSKLSSPGVNTILDYGRELMEEIKKIRNTKECLVRAIQTLEEDHPAITSLHRATYGMILFAIPHKGLVMDDIQQMLGGDGHHPREKLLRQISSQSDVLIHQLADFKNLIRDRKVVSFYETEQTKRLVLDLESGCWKRTGDFMTTVDADSALLQLPDHIEDKVPLHADHSMIVKFDTRNAAGYRTALDKLRQLSKDAPAVVAARFAQTRQKPQPCSTVPFERDPVFVGRKYEINAIEKKHGTIGQRHERVALVGLAGVGKTQTAIEYSYCVRESTPDMWVFWIHASNLERLEQGYRQIAAVTEIPGRDDPKINILQLVYQWLCDARNGRWLIVLDNADDDSIFFRENESKERGPLVNFLPQAAHGSMLITSRNGRAARNLVGRNSHVIEVQPMNEEESVALLRRWIPAPQSGDFGESGEDEKALVQALEYIPLAITQAGSYIANRLPLITVTAYLRLFHESESKRTRLLKNEDSTDLRRDPSIRYAVITTWQISFEQIRQERPVASDLLALMSMFDRQGIPVDLVRESEQDELDFHDALVPLLNYSLIRLEINERLFDMHRLVQLSVRAWLEMHQQLYSWQAKSREIMARVFPDGEYESWTQCRSLLAHAKSVLNSIYDVEGEDRLNTATLLSNCGWFLNLQGAYEEAELMHRRALEAREKVLGREHPSTLISVNNLGLVLSKQGQYDEAEAMHRRALEAREKVLGREHPDTLTSVNNLGLVLSNQGKYEEAGAMHQRALEAREKVLGREHPSTLGSVSNLGNVLGRQGKYEEAEAMYRRALKAREKVLGREHPDTLIGVSNLGVVLFKQGQYEEAEAIYRRALKAREKVLGREHPDTLTSVNNLGDVLSKQGKYEEAEAMHRGALEVKEKVLGREHPSTLISVNNLGLVLTKQGQYEEAEAMYRRALEARQKVLGREHPDTLTSVNNLGLVLKSQGKYKEAEAMYRRALEARQKVLGQEHPDTLGSVNNFASVLSKQGQYKEAEAMYRRALDGYEKVLGREHPDTLMSVNNLGSVLFKQGQYEEAEAMYRRALEARQKVLGREHPDTLTSVNNLGDVLSKQGRHEEAEAMHRWAQTVDSSTLMQQGILLKNIFSTPHPLLQLSLRHHRSLEEKHDRDVD